MNTQLWTTIQQFNFDEPISEYGFSTRLAAENGWTKNFTQKAIAEYKKFMYLAATSAAMVSPSEIVDVVWHQHLIFSQSYADFCALLGKNIQHIPSTHNREELEKFKSASQRTRQLYLENFGEPPTDIWQYPDILSALSLPKARIHFSLIVLIAIALLLTVLAPACLLLRPLFIHINNPQFLIIYLLLVACCLWLLSNYNENKLQSVVDSWPEDSFIKNLTASEVVYLQKQKLKHVIHAQLNRLIERGKILVNKDYTLALDSEVSTSNAEDFVITKQVQHSGKIFYPDLLRKLSTAPVFSTTAKSMDAFKAHFTRSRVFITLFTKNLAVTFWLLLLGTSRFFVGLARDKPVQLIAFVLIILLISILSFLKKLINLVSTNILPNYYRHQVLPVQETAQPDWDYFLLGQAIITASFLPLVQRMDYNDGSVSISGDSSSCGSSGCGSSCGGGCGGCGGD